MKNSKQEQTNAYKANSTSDNISLHKGTDNTEIENRINDILDKLRPFLVNDGGNIELIKYEDHKAYVRLGGACASCGLIDVTLKDGIEMAIQEEIPEVEEVINVK